MAGEKSTHGSHAPINGASALVTASALVEFGRLLFVPIAKAHFQICRSDALHN